LCLYQRPTQQKLTQNDTETCNTERTESTRPHCDLPLARRVEPNKTDGRVSWLADPCSPAPSRL